MTTSAITAISLAILLGGCESSLPIKDDELGSDKDAHGCIASAGYAWCAHTQKCERPWELAKENGLENTSENFEKFCAEPR